MLIWGWAPSTAQVAHDRHCDDVEVKAVVKSTHFTAALQRLYAV
ncbi:MAG: hypothetical protein VKK80_15315 [Prochlorothrix sp.]|nr:hypothetical protein [Prochlorothrix sp.]